MDLGIVVTACATIAAAYLALRGVLTKNKSDTRVGELDLAINEMRQQIKDLKADVIGLKQDLAAVADGRMDLWLHHSVPAWDWMPGCALVEGAGGVARQVEVRGYTWSVAGPPSAAAQVVDLLAQAG